jgi:hypothetical protein
LSFHRLLLLQRPKSPIARLKTFQINDSSHHQRHLRREKKAEHHR